MEAGKPKEIQKSESGLRVLWSDGVLDVFPYSDLRLSCTCAICREQSTPSPTSAWFARACTFRSMDLVGNYALGVMWGDGHRSIFAFDRLKMIHSGSKNENHRNH